VKLYPTEVLRAADCRDVEEAKRDAKGVLWLARGVYHPGALL
jgi:hypothetical protein